MRKQLIFITLISTILLLAGCTSGQNSSGKHNNSNTSSSEENTAIKSIKNSNGPINGFVFYGSGTYRKINAQIMHNDSNNSYKFSMKEEGSDKPYVTFYLAKIINPRTNRYQYVARPISGSKNNDYVTNAIRENKLAVISNSSDARQHNPLMIDMDDIEDNFDLSPTKSFILRS